MKYISLLRGINVSGQKKINMPDLKALYESLKLSNVITYIQSGNVIFESDNKDKVNIQKLIESKIKSSYDFSVPVSIRTDKEIERTIKNNPFKNFNLETKGTKVLFTFLNMKPKKENISKLLEKVKSPKKMVIKDDVVYLLCPKGYGKSKLSNTYIEKQLNLVATTRNWKSVEKLYELSL